MALNKKLLAGAIAGLLFSTNASAIVLDGVAPYKYALELVNGTVLTARVAEAPLNYNFSANEVRYGRFSCNGAELTNIAVSTTAASITLGAVNGNGTNTVFFSMTGSDPMPGPTAAETMDITADVELLNKGNVTCEFAIYDLPSQAQMGGPDGLVIDSGTDGYKVWITRPSGYVFAGTDGEAVADVEDPLGAYFGFVGTGEFGALQFEAVTGVLDKDHLDITLADIFDADTTVTIDGDFTAAADLTWAGVSPDDLDDGAALYEYTSAIPAIGLDGPLIFWETGADAIMESEYTATLDVSTNVGYETSDRTDTVGEIVRNGTQLQAPLVQLPQGWLSRIAITNTGAVPRAYSMEVMTETGRTGTISPATGTVPANGTVVVDLADIVTFSHNRGTINLNVAAPNNQIQGLYQIVNPVAGSLSNHVMVRPGTN